MKNLLLNVLLLLFSLLLVEVSSFVSGIYLKKKGVFYNVPQIDNYKEYLEDRDPVLGWPSKSQLVERYDAEGSRPTPAFPDPTTPACASVYGDSFTWGDNVDDHETIPNYMSNILNCRVSNFGVAGYGTDQTLLRFKQNLNDEAPIIVFNHFSGDIRRNVTRLRNLMADSNSQYILFKPRFILKESRLELLPLLSPSMEELGCFANTPEKCIEHEYFVPGGDSGVQYLKFPYSASLIRALKNEHLQAKFQGVPVWSKFYQEEHSSQALQLTAEIIKEFVRLAKDRNKVPLVAVTGNVHDIEYFQKTGDWAYSRLIKLLNQSGIQVENLTSPLVQYLGDRNPCELGNENCYGHYTREANEQIAELLANKVSMLASK